MNQCIFPLMQEVFKRSNTKTAIMFLPHAPERELSAYCRTSNPWRKLRASLKSDSLAKNYPQTQPKNKLPL